MRKNYKKLSLLSRWVVGLLSVGSFQALNAQLSGTVTVGTSGNYTSWSALATALNNSGVSGPLTINVTSDLSESNTVTFNQHSTNPTTSSNSISVNGNGFKLSSSATNAGIVLNGIDYVKFEGLILQKTGTGTAQFGFILTGGADYNTLEKCTIEYTNLSTGTTAGGAYIAVTNSTTSATTNGTTVYPGRFNVFNGNLLRTTNVSSPGPSYGIIIKGATSIYTSTASDNSVTNNTIENFNFQAIHTNYTNGDQLLNNDISRANSSLNNGATSVSVIYAYYTYGTNRATRISSNYIHDLPFKGATAGYSSTFNGINAWYNYGSSSLYFDMTKNKFENIVTSATSYYIYSWYIYWTNMSNNSIENCRSLGTSAHYGFYTYYAYNDLIMNDMVYRNNFTKGSTYWSYHFFTDKVTCKRNIYKNNITADGSTGITYGLYIYKRNSTAVIDDISENVLDSNILGSTAYMTYLFYVNGYINKNKITNNQIFNANNSSYNGYLYGLMIPYFLNMQCNNNLIANNWGASGMFGIYGYSYVSGSLRAEMRQNTIYADVSKTRNTFNYNYGLYFLPYYHTDIAVDGNIVDMQNGYYVYPVYAFNLNGAQNFKSWDYNTYWIRNFTIQYWYCNNGNASDYNGWKNLGFAGNNENFLNPTWAEIGKTDYRSNAFETQNNVPRLDPIWPIGATVNSEDVNSKARNNVRSDRGAVENFMNITNLKTDFTIAKTVCAGSEFLANIYLKNNFVDTIYGFNVSFGTVGTGPRVSQKVNSRILPGDSAEIKISTPLALTVAGDYKLAVYVDAADDLMQDDSIYFETKVLEAPGGANFNTPAPATTQAIYQRARPNDITVLNNPVVYDIPAPRKYSNSTYNTSPSGDWMAEVSAITPSKRVIPGASISAPTANSNLRVTFKTSDKALEDSMITIVLRVYDHNNGCDTFIRRNVFIYPSITPLFNFPAQICEGQDVLFENVSKVKSGGMEFKWNFGTGNAADTTDAPEPVFAFGKSGTYKVKLTAKTIPHFFKFDTIIDVLVNPIPTVSFTKNNACEGDNIVFKNSTVPNTAKFNWTFGDGTTSVVAEPSKKYNRAGQYTVTLTADLNGCVATQTRKVYQFTRPKANFDKLVGSCDNDEFEFNNRTTVTAGLFGSNWNFDDNGNVSTDVNAKHDFQTAGNKNVKLVVTSEFGCKDSITKVVAVKPSPKASFVNGPLCSVKPTSFVNTTPDVGGTIANYAWSFGDGSTSGAKSPTKDWFGNLGPKKVTLKVTLDNGCSESVSKDLMVLTQPKPNFTAEDVCAGDDVIFVNNTTWAQGDITYRWNFGDGTESTNSDPTKKYNTSVTLTPFVTLYAFIQGGCGDSITKNITINETPRTCDFVASADYASGFYGMKFEPINRNGVLGGQEGVDYIWVFEGGGTKKTKDKNATVINNFATDGTYKVTMRAMMTQTKCECSVSKLVEMNRSSAESLMTSGVAVYPNPNNGQFTVATTEAFGKNVTVEVMSLSGAVVKRMSNQVGGMISVDASEVSNGMYLVKVMSGDKVVSTKINIQH
jgi:PKD repeat protein